MIGDLRNDIIVLGGDIVSKDKKVSVLVKRRLAILGPISLLMCLFFCFTLMTNSIKIKQLSDEKQKLESELTELKEEQDTLSSQITKYKNTEYAAKYAIESWHVTKDGIIALIMDNEKLNDDINSDNYKENTYKRYAVISFIIIVVFLLLTKIVLRKKKATK